MLTFLFFSVDTSLTSQSSPSSILAGGSFFLLCYRWAEFSHCFAFVDFFCYHAPACRRPIIYFIAAPQAQQNTEQSARTKPESKYVPIRVRQRKPTGRASTVYCSTASRAQHNAISPHKAVKQVLADQSVTTQASRQELARASACQQLTSTLSSQNEPRHKNLPSVQHHTAILTQRW